MNKRDFVDSDEENVDEGLDDEDLDIGEYDEKMSVEEDNGGYNEE